MLKWQHFFPTAIVQRGRDYYKQNKVRSLIQDGDKYYAVVKGEKEYDVYIRVSHDKLEYMSCTCPYAEDGNLCKHMAATLYEITARENPALLARGTAMKEKTAEHRKIQPFLELNEKEAEQASPPRIGRWTADGEDTGLISMPAQEDEAMADMDEAMDPDAKVYGQVSPAVQIEEAPDREAPEADTAQFVPDENYLYYLPSRFTGNLDIYEDTWEKAQKLLKSGAITNFQTGLIRIRDRDGAVREELYSNASVTKSPYYPVSIRIDRDRVTEMNCPVYKCRGYFRSYSDPDHMEICEHCLALLIHMVEEIQAHPEWDATDSTTRMLVKSYWEGKNPSQNRSVERSRSARLEPRLEETEEGLQLQFRIGTDERLYVLKNLESLVDAVTEGREFPLGTKASLNFADDSFADEDEAWYTLIRQAVIEKRHHEDPEDRKKKLPGIDLYGTQMDSFFDLAEGKELEYKSKKGGKAILKLEKGMPDIVLSLNRDASTDGVFHGMILEGRLPRVFDGAKHRYALERNRFRLFQMTAKRNRVFDSLLESAGEDGILRMRIGRSHLPEFCYRILPELRGLITIDEPDHDEMVRYLPPEVSFRFFLDAVNGTPVCRPAAHYGDDRGFFLTDWLQGEISAPATAYRDKTQEMMVLSRVQGYFPVSIGDGELSSEEDDDAVYRVLTEGLDLLWSMGEVLSTARFDALRIRRNIRIQLGISVESDLMDLQIQSDDLSLAELAAVLNSYRQKKKYHRLRSGEFVPMNDSIAELASLADTLRLSPEQLLQEKLSVPAYRALYIETMLENAREIYATRDRHYRRLIKDFNTVRDSDYEVPENLVSVMRPYQIYGYKWIRTLAGCGFGGILADEMGLGKTLQTIAAILAEKNEGSVGTSLIVCPASLVYNWLEEFHRFAPELSVCPVEGNQAERKTIITRSGKWDVLVTSYDHLKRDVAAYENKMFQYEVLDEAQFIKNQATAAAKAVKVIRGKHRLALTGTPIENRLSELWSIFDFLMPGFLYRYETFRTEMERPIAKDGDEETTARLRRMVAPFILRRLKTEVLQDLPEKVEESHVVRFDQEQQRIYDAQVLRMKNLLQGETEETFRKSKIQILAELTRIRQICCDPALMFEGYTGGSAKLEACMDLVTSAIEGEHRILIFSQFTSMLELIQTRLNDSGIPYYVITGATPKRERVQMVSDFNGGDVPVFLISLRAGGTGLNLTGADIVIHYDPWWNAAAQNQATDRAHRIGQEKPVTVYKLIAKDSIEEKITLLQEKKLSLADEIIGGEQVSFSSLSREELLELLD